VPTLAGYDRLRGRAAALKEAKERMAEHEQARVVAAGGILTEGDFRGEVKFSDGGISEDMAGEVASWRGRIERGEAEKVARETVDWIEAKSTRGPSARLLVRRGVRKNGGD